MAPHVTPSLEEPLFISSLGIRGTARYTLIYKGQELVEPPQFGMHQEILCPADRGQIAQ
jgi:hypothetical protein